MIDGIDLSRIQDEQTRELIVRLMNLIEQLAAENRDLRAKNQELRDEINRLKGEQGKPNIKGNKRKPDAPQNHSSEKERRSRPLERGKKSKKAQIKIDREEVVKVSAEALPKDAEFKGYVDVVVQDIVLKTDNVLFHKEKYYSASERQSYVAEMPPGYSGQFGPGVQALALVMYYGVQASEPKIHEFFANVGVEISEGQVSNLLIKKQAEFHQESAEVYDSGLRSSPWQHTDDTLTRVNGENQHCHVVCNPVYTAYHTRPTKERLSVLDVLRQGRPRIFRLNDEALGYVGNLNWSKKAWRGLLNWAQKNGEQDLEEGNFLAELDAALPKLSAQRRKALIDAAAIAAYHAETAFAVIQALICDDAPQFNWLTRECLLCWVHEGRPYKKLIPVIPLHRDLLADFLKRFWKFYAQLLLYRQSPSPEKSQILEAEFDRLFATRTGYDELDQRIAKSQAKKANLLLVLKHPELPLHNNPAELGARQRVRKRDVSFGPRTQDGVRAWDTFATLAATTKKLGLSFYCYIFDRISEAHQIVPLAHLVENAAKQLNLGWSWAPG
ncbi:MAG TPA: transposase [Anaerolineaceae bacterium]|nr:transposase [Anaerolineaceae bacterium]